MTQQEHNLIDENNLIERKADQLFVMLNDLEMDYFGFGDTEEGLKHIRLEYTNIGIKLGLLMEITDEILAASHRIEKLTFQRDDQT